MSYALTLPINIAITHKTCNDRRPANDESDIVLR